MKKTLTLTFDVTDLDEGEIRNFIGEVAAQCEATKHFDPDVFDAAGNVEGHSEVLHTSTTIHVEMA